MNTRTAREWSRREMLELMASGTLAAAFGAGTSWAQPKRKPNVIVIYTDDQGSVDMGVYGANDLMTPNMDALAARGRALHANVCTRPRVFTVARRHVDRTLSGLRWGSGQRVVQAGQFGHADRTGDHGRDV